MNKCGLFVTNSSLSNTLFDLTYACPNGQGSVHENPIFFIGEEVNQYLSDSVESHREVKHLHNHHNRRVLVSWGCRSGHDPNPSRSPLHLNDVLVLRQEWCWIRGESGHIRGEQCSGGRWVEERWNWMDWSRKETLSDGILGCPVIVATNPGGLQSGIN